MKEIERRWLVKGDPIQNDKFMNEAESAYFEDILNVYRDNIRIRFRVPYGLNHVPPLVEYSEKTGEGIVRTETIYVGYPKTKLNIKASTPEPFTRKTRIWLPNDKLCKELILDLFIVPRINLNIIEAEFETLKVAKAFKFPEYISELEIEEITGKPEYSNYALAQEAKDMCEKPPSSDMEEMQRGMEKLLEGIDLSKIGKKIADS